MTLHPLPATLTLREATAALRAFEASPADGLDASALATFDSSALAVMLGCARMNHAAGRPFTVRGVPPKLADLAGLYGLDDLLPGLAPGADAVRPPR